MHLTLITPLSDHRHVLEFPMDWDSVVGGVPPDSASETIVTWVMSELPQSLWHPALITIAQTCGTLSAHPDARAHSLTSPSSFRCIVVR